MFKRLALTTVLLLTCVVAALAAPMAGKVAAVKDKEVQVTVTGKLADWVKKGAAVKFLGAKGTIVSVAGSVVTISSPKAVKAKAGDAVNFDKFKATAGGC